MDEILGNRPTTMAIALAFEDAIGRRDLERIAELLHPEARVETLADGAAAAHPPNDLLVVVEDAARQGIFQTSVAASEQLDETTVLITGRARYSLPDGGFSDRPVAWLDEVRDDRLWRRRVFSDPEEARAGHERTKRQPTR